MYTNFFYTKAAFGWVKKEDILAGFSLRRA